jgi:hypothetical protein
MSAVLPLVLFGLAGLLAGGAWSVYRQRSGRGLVAVLAVLAGLALAGGIAWLLPGD